MRSVAFVLLISMLANIAAAVEPDEVLADPALEARARAIDTQLRCVVCQSQSIAESNAPLAKDLRVLVRERLTNGDSDAQVMTYVVDRYGDYVLLRPPMQTNTILLWVFPGVILIVGAVMALFYVRRQAREIRASPLDEDDEEAIKRIIDECA